MAKKDDLDLDFEDDDLGLDDDLDNLSLDFDMAEAPPPKDTREAITRSVKDVGKGIADVVKDDPMTLASEIAKNAIPRALSSEASEIIDIHGSIRDTFTEAAKEIRSTGRQTIQAVNRIVPEHSPIRKVLDKINAKLGPAEEEVSSGPSKEEIQNANIATSVAEALGEQFKIDQVNELIRNAVDEKRHLTTAEILSNISAESEQLRKFHFEITNSYYRRSLELQYKSLFTAREQVDVLKTGIDTFKNQFETIINNTALPDIIKVKNNELLKETLAARARESMADLFYSDYNPLSNIKKNAIDKITTSLSGFKEGLSGAGEMANQAADMSELSAMAGTKSFMFGNMVAGAGRDFLAKTVGNKLAKTSVGKDLVFGIKDNLSDPNAYLQKQLESTYETDEEGKRSIFNKVKGGIFSTLTDLTGTPTVNRATFDKKELDEVSLFDGRAHNSIVKIIPGLLSKIYGEVKSLRTNTKPEDNEIFFDPETDTFRTKKEYKEKITTELSNTINRNSTTHISNVMELLKDHGLKVSKEEEKQISSSLLNYMLQPGSTVNPSILVNNKFLETLDPKIKVKVKEASNELLEAAKSDYSLMDNLSHSMSSIRRSLPNLNKKLTDLHKSGLVDIAKDMNLVTQDERTKQHFFNVEGNRDLILNAYDKIDNKDLEHEIEYRAKEKEDLDSKKTLSVKDKLVKLKKDSISTHDDVKYEKDKLVKKTKDKLKPLKPTMLSKKDEVVKTFKNFKDNYKPFYTGGFTGSKNRKRPTDINGNELVGSTHAEEFVINNKDLNNPVVPYIINKLNLVSGKIPDKYIKRSKNKVNNIQEEVEELFSNKDKLVKDFKERATINTDKAILSVKEMADRTSDKLKEYKIPTLEEMKTLRYEFFNSLEFKSGAITDFSQYINSLGYKIPDKDSIFLNVNDYKEKALGIVREKSKEALNDMLDFFKKPRPLEELKEEFFNSEEYKSGAIQDFKTWIQSMGYQTEDKGSLIRRFFKKTRELDRKMFKAIPSVIGKGVKLTGSLIGLGGKATGTIASKTGGVLKDVFNIGEDNLTKQTLSKTRSVDKEIIKSVPSVLATTLKAPFTAIGKVLTVLSKKDKSVSKDPFDKDGSGKRDGSWMDRLNIFSKDKDLNKNKGLKDKVTGFIKDNKGISITAGLLAISAFLKAMNISMEDVKDFLSGMKKGFVAIKDVAVSIGSGIMKIYDAVSPIVKTIANIGIKIGEGIGNMASGIWGFIKKIIPDWMLPDEAKSDTASKDQEVDENGNPIDGPERATNEKAVSAGELTAYGVAGALAYKPAKMIYKGGKAVVGVTKAAVGATKTVASATSTAATAASNVINKVKPTTVATGALEKAKPKAGKIMSILNNFKEKIIKKLGPKSGKVILAKLAGKLAARAVPIAGAALLAYDATMIAKDMITNGTDFKSAVSKQILGFDLFSDDAVLDEDGNVVKPDEDIVNVESNVDSNSSVLSAVGNVPSNNITYNQSSQQPANNKEYSRQENNSSFTDRFYAMKDKVSDYTSNAISKVKTYVGKGWDVAKDFVSKGIGNVAAYFESGKSGAGTISSGRGDFGGVSYGTHQLASKTGTLQKYLAGSKYKAEFEGLIPSTPPFNAKWKEIYNRDPKGFAEDQEAFIANTHYVPQVNKLKKDGLNVEQRSDALKSAVYSVGVQFGPGSSLIPKALQQNNVDPKTADDAAVIKSIYDYKKDNNDSLFRSSSVAVRQGTLNRAHKEEAMVLSLLSKDTSSSNNVDNKETTPSNSETLTNKLSDNIVTKNSVNNVEYVKTDVTTNNTKQNNVENSTIDKPTLSKGISNINSTNDVVTTAVKENTKIDIASDSNKLLSSMSDTLSRSLETQIRMANTLDKILEATSLSREIDKTKLSDESVNKEKNSKAINNPTALQDPVISMKRAAY